MLRSYWGTGTCLWKHWLDFSRSHRRTPWLTLITKPSGVFEKMSDQYRSDIWGIRRDLGEWIVNSMPPKSFSAFPTSAWAKLPTDLSWMKKMYADSLVEELNLDPGILVDVQGACRIQSGAVLDLTFSHSLGSDLTNPPPNATCRHVKMRIGEVALTMLDPEAPPQLNALSIPSSGVHGGSEIYR